MSKLGRWSCKRLGAVPIEEGGLDDGEAESTSQPLFWAELNRDNGGRELLAEAEDGRGGVMSREAACQRDYHSLAAETATMWQHSEQTYGRVNWQQTRPQ